MHTAFTQTVETKSDQPYSNKNIIPIDEENYLKYLSDAVNQFASLPNTYTDEEKLVEEKPRIEIINVDLLSARKDKKKKEKEDLKSLDDESFSENVVLKPIEYTPNKNCTRINYNYKGLLKSTAYNVVNNLPTQMPIISALSQERTGYKQADYDVHAFSQTKVPQRHVDVSLMKDRYQRKTDYRGPYNLDPTEYIKSNTFIEHLENQ